MHPQQSSDVDEREREKEENKAAGMFYIFER